MSTITIADLINNGEASIQTGPFGTQLKAKDYVESGTPVINVKNIGFGSIRSEGLEFINNKMTEKLSAHILQQGDIVFGRKGAVERHAFIKNQGHGWVQGSDCLRLRINSERIDNRFVSYYFKTKAHQDWMQALCSFGATMASLNQDIVKRIEVPFPPLPTQQKIAAILTAYDDLIETNNRRIQLLENMAEEIYREWFVRLRFPGHESVKVVKGVPEGWEMLSIKNLCSLITDGSHSSPAHQENSGYFMASVKDMESNGFNTASMKNISESDYLKLVKGGCKPEGNDILIAKDGSYLKHVFVWREDYDLVLLSSIAILRPDLTRVSPYFLVMVLKQPSTKSMMSAFVSGSALPRIILKDFKKMQLLVPSFSLMGLFEKTASQIFDQMNMLKKTNQNLTQTRDKLLPRLISGKLSVENLDIHFPPSMQDS